MFIYNMTTNISVKKVALFTNARDEKHIREWAAHHLLIGFDYIIIFDHNSIIPLSDVFLNFDKRVTIIRYNTPPKCDGVKSILMNKAIHIARKLNVDWFIYLDADEFIILNNNLRGVKALLTMYHFADSLGINWLMFGSNNLIKDPDDLILNSYTKSELNLDKHVKTFVRPFKALNSINAHFYNITNPKNMHGVDKALDQNREPFCFNSTNLNYTQVPAYIAHHLYQSEESFYKRKIIKERDDNGELRAPLSYDVIHSLHNHTENLYPKIKYVENIKNFLNQYNCSY
jgi:hypothetical protein